MSTTGNDSLLPTMHKAQGRAFLTFARAVFLNGPKAASGPRAYVADVYEAVAASNGTKPQLVRVTTGRQAPSAKTARDYATEELSKILGKGETLGAERP